MRFGNGSILAYGSAYRHLEWNLNESRKEYSYAKVIVNKQDNKRVVGIHYVGPNAGEIIQGFAVALLKGITK